MLQSLWVRNYRAFEYFSIDGLSRVNLVVGANNCGKTTILEAAELLAGGGGPQLVIGSLSRRGEYLLDADANESRHLEICHLFHGHKLRRGAEFVVGGKNGGDVVFSCAIKVGSGQGGEQEQLLLDESEGPLAAVLTLSGSERTTGFRLSDRGGVQVPPGLQFIEESDARPVGFVTTSALDSQNLGQMWGDIALTHEESEVIAALRIVEPGIERIAFLGGVPKGRWGTSPSGIFVKLKDSDSRVPLGSLGEGTARLLGLSLALAKCAGGALMIDEIDTGLHYSILTNIWKMVIETARRLDVQVFATTHSYDCVRSLALLYEQHPEIAKDVALHRIERGADKAATYPAEQLSIAARHDMELR